MANVFLQKKSKIFIKNLINRLKSNPKTRKHIEPDITDPKKDLNGDIPKTSEIQSLTENAQSNLCFFNNLVQFYLKLRCTTYERHHIAGRLVDWIHDHNGDEVQVFEKLQTLWSEINRPEYAFLLGFFHLWEIGAEYNEKKAIRFYDTAAKNEYSVAQSELAFYYSEGIIVFKNDEKAFKLYELSACSDDPLGQFGLALCYHSGIGTRIDNYAAFHFYQVAARNGCRKASQVIQGFNKYGASGFDCYSRRKGDSYGWYELGKSIENGWGFAKNHKDAFNCYQKSVESGYCPEGENALGMCYTKAIGTVQDLEKAFKWFEISAKNEYPMGQYHFGLCYWYGDGTSWNKQTAVLWLRKSAAHGCLKGMAVLGYAYMFGKGILRNPAKSFICYYKSARDDLVISSRCADLAKLYKDGLGTQQDIHAAVRWAYIAEQSSRSEKASILAREIVDAIFLTE
ncbi:hypothetical protein G9A89_023012 [Geosiphon pyriformis]|nr:hypothetical protein G9A89_023012 [Geosiphon pyriformis]